ncbi:SLC13 family permease [bacterium]|nr:SLC13 family permease [bacterium]
MSFELAAVLVLLLMAVVMFAINRPRMDVVALLVMTVLPFLGVITMSEAISGFSDPNIVLIAALFVIGEGLVRTGVAQQLGDWLLARAGTSETLLITLLMAVVCLLGATMSSTAVTAIFIPVAMRIAKSTGTAPSQLMMPLSFAALISGMMTLVATAPNLVVNSELSRHGLEGFAFFAFTPFGSVVLLLGIVYMLVARHWLPSSKDERSTAPLRPSLADWVDRYRLADREVRLRVLPGSSLAGKRVDELSWRQEFGANIIAIDRKRGFSREVLRPTAKTDLQADDILLVDLQEPRPDFRSFTHGVSLETIPLSGVYFNDLSQELGMAEVMVGADSAMVGKSIVEMEMRTRTGLTVIGLRHGSQSQEQGLLHQKLRVGDTLLVLGRWDDIASLSTSSNDLVPLNLPVDLEEVLPVAGRAPQAILCLLLVVGLMVSGVVPNVQAALIGCLLMGLFGCIDITSAYRSISWKTIVLIVGMLPFSTALQRTGGVDLAADGLMSFFGQSSIYVILTALFAITAGLGLFISNTATAVLMAPVALAIAEDLHASPYPFAMIVALAASTAFVTPVSSPVNTLVVGPGNYSFSDFVRVGGPFALIVMAVSVIMVPWLLPVYLVP